MKQQAFSTTSLTESIVAFAGFARSQGLNIGLQETQGALLAADAGLLVSDRGFRYALKAIFSHSPEEGQLFDRLFTLYWDTNPTDMAERKSKVTLQGAVIKKANASLILLGQGNTEPGEEEEAKSVTGANETERLKHTDLTQVGILDGEKLEAIARRLFREMALRLRRRQKSARRKGRISLRRTIRRSMGYGGEPLDLLRKAPAPKKQRLIVLLDVSGSMDKYSFYLLRFISAMKAHFRQMEAFVFSTSLVRISKALQQERLDLVLERVSAMSDNWSGGTRIGECLREFNTVYGKRMLNGSPLLVIMSDGLDTGEPDMLRNEMSYLQRRVRKVVWLNPLKGMQGYTPTAKGMQAALPLVDEFRTAHNLESILELENLLADA
jgi:uncharacterized protein with von Willebrand factor type A (vWA) domain